MRYSTFKFPTVSLNHLWHTKCYRSRIIFHWNISRWCPSAMLKSRKLKHSIFDLSVFAFQYKISLKLGYLLWNYDENSVFQYGGRPPYWIFLILTIDGYS